MYRSIIFRWFYGKCVIFIGEWVVMVNDGWWWVVICIYIGNDMVIGQWWVII